MRPFEGSEVAQSCATLCYPMDCIAYQAPPSMEFSRQEDWNGLPFPSPGDLPYPGIKSRSPALQVDALPSVPPRKPKETHYLHYLYHSLASGQTTGKEHSPVLIILERK